MAYETSYESSRKPFQPDLKRGKWEHPHDYVYACVGLALQLDASTSAHYMFYDTGISGILPYFAYMALYLVPLMVIHSFMGQFGSSGFISAFRMSPFFKGMGYVNLAISTLVLTYYTLFATIPIIFLFYSLRPSLPWSCEVFPNTTNTTCDYNKEDDGEYNKILVPSVEFFQNHFDNMKLESRAQKHFAISWALIGVTILFWSMVAYVFHQFSETAKFGNFMRYLVGTTLFLILVCLVRFLFLPTSSAAVKRYVSTDLSDITDAAYEIPVFTLQAFGCGWGNFMVLSSFNNFKTNILKYSYVIAFGQVFVYIMLGLVTYMLTEHFDVIGTEASGFVEYQWLTYISSASVLATLHWSNLWTFLYYTMLLLAATLVIVTQIFSILKTIFDEFELLRQHKQEVTFGFIGIIGLCSLYFCSNHAIVFFSAFIWDSLFIQCILHLLLLLVVLWIYGRERFQRDFHFMTGEYFVGWKIWFLRYIAPLLLWGTLGSCLFEACFEHLFYSKLLSIMSVALILVPLLCIPGYGIYITCQTRGSFWLRLRRTFRPTDWYPVEMEDRQKYEETLGTANITHQLYEVTEENQ